MDCAQARLLLVFSRPAETLGHESDALHGHLEQCGDCRELAHREHAADEAVGRAMRDVTPPTGLASRILDRLEQSRRPSPWTWLSVAAVVFLTAGLTLGWYLRPLPSLDVTALFPASHHGTDAETVSRWLTEQGFAVEAPQVIDYAYLESFQMASVQGRQVPELIFVNQAHGTMAVAHVYVVSGHEFHVDKQEVEQSSGSRSPELIAAPNGFWYLIIYSLGSRESFPRPPSA